MKILIATDGSGESGSALEKVAARPWPRPSTIRVLSVAETVYRAADLASMDGAAFEQIEARSEADAEAVVSAAAKTFKTADIAVETKVRRGDPRNEIVEEAVEWAADLVVVGSHGRTGFKRWVLGSVAEYVVRHAPCSVEVVRQQPHRATGVAKSAPGASDPLPQRSNRAR